MTLLDKVNQYYSEKVNAHGPTPQGVDWNSQESQELRFAQLLKVTEDFPFSSINDIGCGYGHLRGYLHSRSWKGSYYGIDISKAMIDEAISLYGDLPDTVFIVGEACAQSADYTVASGIFNVRLDTTDEEWEAYIYQTIEAMDRVSGKGFAFNCLTKYSDPPLMRANLYYADPCALFDFCKTNLSKSVALLHDYGLYEFTILVRKDIPVSQLSPGLQP